ELWEAISEQPLQPGDRAEVVKLDGLTLHVKPTIKKGVA
ncbi:MAG: NfeD family protein, partial [Nitrospirota bacterium]|nr:NfeD family protein [Nitrospirota bacterium]